MDKNIYFQKTSERGSALVYILIAIALLAALTMTFMEPSSQQTSSQSSFRTLSGIQSQADVIRSAIQECVLRYSNGDTNIPTDPGDDDEGANKIYPIRPDSDYYTGADIGPTTGTRLVRDIRCPGHRDGTDANDHGKVFGAGKYLPPPAELFEDWQYYNGDDGVFFWTSTDKTDAFLLSAMEKLDGNYSECEADIVDTSVGGGGAKGLDSGGTVSCPDGSICFRVRMTSTGSAVWNGDADSDESGCP